MVRSIGSIPSPTGRILIQGISRAVRSLFKHARHRYEIKALADLDDRLLKDVGLTRGDVEGALSASLLDNPSMVLVRSVGRYSQSETTGAKPVRPVVPAVSRSAQA